MAVMSKVVDRQPQVPTVPRDVLSELYGCVKLINHGKGYGFLHCEEVQQLCGKDVFVDARELVDYNIGDNVSFIFSKNYRGDPQGTNVKPCSISGTPAGRRPNLNSKDRFVGLVKSFDARHRFGFIACSESHSLFGRDVFVHENELSAHKIGERVSFSIKVSYAGHPQAYSLCSPSSTAMWLSSEPEVQTSLEDEWKALGTFVGEVKSIAWEYGFIYCQSVHNRFGCDVYFPRSLLADANVGEAVEFDARQKGSKVQAQSVRRASSISSCELPLLNGKEHVDKQSATNQKVLTAAEQSRLDKKLLRACMSTRHDSYREMFNLLSDGADPNTRDVTDQTALMVAALSTAGSEKKCRLLVGMRADVNIVYQDGLTVLDWARERLSNSFSRHLEALSKGEHVDCAIVLQTMGASEI